VALALASGYRSAAMAAQLALFPGTVTTEGIEAAPGPPMVEVEPLAAPLSASQMGLFDAQVRRLRTALDAVAIGDLPAAASLFEGLAPEFDPSVPTMRRRVTEVQLAVEHVGTLPPAARVEAQLELGRSLATDIDPWTSLGRVLIARAAAELGPGDAVLAARLFMEARDPQRARSVLLAAAGPPNAATLFALGDVETALDDRPAARRHYRDALLLDPFDAAFDAVADEDVCGLPYVAEFEVEVEGDPQAWCAPVGIVAGILPRPREAIGELPMPADAPADRSEMLARAREFVDALVRTGAPDVQRDRDALLDARRCMKRASAALFAWYMARQVGRPDVLVPPTPSAGKTAR